MEKNDINSLSALAQLTARSITGNFESSAEDAKKIIWFAQEYREKTLEKELSTLKSNYLERLNSARASAFAAAKSNPEYAEQMAERAETINQFLNDLTYAIHAAKGINEEVAHA